MGQFERTLIIAGRVPCPLCRGLHGPTYSSDSLHSAVVEIEVMEGARVRYTTIQNWSNNVYNLVTKRPRRFAMRRWNGWTATSAASHNEVPGGLLMEPGARGDILSVAFASDGMHQDAGAKIVHVAPYTTSKILRSRSRRARSGLLSRPARMADRGRSHTKSSVRCDALLLDEEARTDTYP